MHKNLRTPLVVCVLFFFIFSLFIFPAGAEGKDYKRGYKHECGHSFSLHTLKKDTLKESIGNTINFRWTLNHKFDLDTLLPGRVIQIRLPIWIFYNLKPTPEPAPKPELEPKPEP